VREKPIMARHHRMPPEEAGYTYAVEPTANNRLLANEEESIYRRSTPSISGRNCIAGRQSVRMRLLCANWLRSQLI
jgi:hypothetical protein